jgi:membrane protease YdiL (CAAX protease family)
MTETSPQSLVRVRNLVFICAVCVGLAFLLNAIAGPTPLLTIALIGKPLLEQLGWGIASALAFGIPMWLAVLFLPSLASLRNQLIELVSRLDLSGLNPLWFSVLAGIGEETLFRGALQPIVGIWWASLIFVLLHFRTYQFRSMNWQKAISAAGVFLASLFLGYIFSKIGLVAAIIAHTTLDTVGLFWAQRQVCGNAACA